MEVAYDAVQKESYPENDVSQTPASDLTQTKDASPRDRTESVSHEFRDAYKDFSNSSWGAKFGGWWNSAKAQGQSYYEAAQKELSEASSGARGVADLGGNTGTLTESQVNREATPTPDSKPRPKAEVPDNLGKDIVKEAGSLLSGFQFMAGERLKQVQAAEDAADEALVKFGTNLRNYLKDAVKVTAPEAGKDGTVKSVLFESRDQEGRRVVHATRFDAQLHVIHSNPGSFTKDPDTTEFARWREGFDVEKKTDAIAQDLSKYDELRRAMEKLVPEKVEHAAFWARYYFLRHVVEEQEQKRRELLKGADDEEEVKWDDDDDDDEQKAPATPKVGTEPEGAATPKKADSEKSDDHLKPTEGRRSNDNSVADSDTSYDMVSGATSRGPDSPKEDKEKKREGTAEQSDDDDWE